MADLFGLMTAIGDLNIIPFRKGSLSSETAAAIEALERFDIGYETNPVGTFKQAEKASEMFEAAQTAHEAVDEDRMITTRWPIFSMSWSCSPFENPLGDSRQTDDREGKNLLRWFRPREARIVKLTE